MSQRALSFNPSTGVLGSDFLMWATYQVDGDAYSGSGVVDVAGGHLAVEENTGTMEPYIRAGAVFIKEVVANAFLAKSYIGELDADTTVTVTANATGSNRVDAVVAYINTDSASFARGLDVLQLVVVAGDGITALDDSEVATAIDTLSSIVGTPWTRLADITVPNGATQIDTANIADTRTQYVLVTPSININDGTLFVNSVNGRVGIGTDAPSELLHIYDASKAAEVRVQGNIAVDGQMCAAVALMGKDDGGNITTYSAIKGYCVDNTDSTEDGELRLAVRVDGTISDVLYIDETKRVGIMEGTPLSRLHVLESDTGGTVDSTAVITIEENANTALQLLTGTSNQAFILFGDTASSTVGYIGYNHSADSMTFRVNGGNKWVIESDGRFNPQGTTKTIDIGHPTASAVDHVWADDFQNVADIPWLDERTEDGQTVLVDDLSIIRAIKPSNDIDERTGFRLIDDWSLPEWFYSKAKDDLFMDEVVGANEDGTEIVKKKLVAKKGELLIDKDGKPYYSTRTMIGLILGAIRKLDTQIIKVK